MKFQYLPIAQGQTGPDPMVSPQLVDSAYFFDVPARPSVQADVITRSLMFSLDATLGNTASVALYAIDVSTLPGPDVVPTTDALAARKFYSLATSGSLDLIARELRSWTMNVVGGQKLYVRVVTNNIVGSGRIVIACGA